MSIHDEFEDLAGDVAETFGMRVTLSRQNSGGAFDFDAGSESGGSTVSCVMRANRVDRRIEMRQGASGSPVKVEIVVYEFALADVQTVVSGTWGLGDPAPGDVIAETATEDVGTSQPGDGKTRRIKTAVRLAGTGNVRVECEELASLGG